ncbi:MORN repeat-containing protein [Methylocystis sp. JAN1]|uniref:MORN repeat-containing protein n=1 Tax=Methylocystis sp. JAN1 TaxID=3397211 RepID=UPI003FA326CB
MSSALFHSSFTLALLALFAPSCASAQSGGLPPCPASRKVAWTGCQGAYTYDDWAKYVGEFKDDRRHGQGTIIYPDGQQYSGGFKNDRREGAGVYMSPNGNKWTGEFKNDRPNGRGVLTDKSGKVLKAGYWTDGVFIGEEPPRTPAR